MDTKIKKYVLSSICIIWATLLIAQNGEIHNIKGLSHNPGNLKGSIYIPDKLTHNSRKKPLVVLLHGCNQNPNQLLDISGFQKYADSLGFYILLPEQKISNNPNKCFNWFNEKDISHQEEGESKSIVSMINYAVGNFPIDTYTVHVVGVSAGAAMANALLLHYPKVFNSGAVIAGGPVGQAQGAVDAMKILSGKLIKSEEEYRSSCLHCKNIRKFPKIMLVHGEEDKVVAFQNLNEATKQWKSIKKKNLYDSIKNQHYLNNDQLSAMIYMDSLGHELIKTISIRNLGHKYPQSIGSCFGNSGKDGLFAEDINYNLTLDIVHFFGLVPRRFSPNRKSDPTWENKYVSLRRYCDGIEYELETSTDSCHSNKFVNYTLSEMNGCFVMDYYYIYK